MKRYMDKDVLKERFDKETEINKNFTIGESD